MRYLSLILFSLAFANGARAQDLTPPHQVSVVPTESRFEIVQSPLVAKGTYRIDKFTGVVHQIVKNKDDEVLWQEVPRRRHPLDRRVEGKVNYQLFTSGLAVRFTYLLNVNTGATWGLIETAEKELVWSPIP